MSVKQPTLPGGTSLVFASLTEALPGDDVFFAAGSDTPGAIDSICASKASLNSALTASFSSLGELAESPGSVESTLEKNRTRNYVIPGKRTNAVSITIAGISNKQKAYLESTAFSSTEFTFALISRDRSRVVIFNGMRWKADWIGEVDSVPLITLTSDFAGDSSKIRVYKDLV